MRRWMRDIGSFGSCHGAVETIAKKKKNISIERSGLRERAIETLPVDPEQPMNRLPSERMDSESPWVSTGAFADLKYAGMQK